MFLFFGLINFSKLLTCRGMKRGLIGGDGIGLL